MTENKETLNPHGADSYFHSREYARALSVLSAELYCWPTKGEFPDVCDFRLREDLNRQKQSLYSVSSDLSELREQNLEFYARDEMYAVIKECRSHEERQFEFNRWCSIMDKVPVVVPSICCRNIMDDSEHCHYNMLPETVSANMWLSYIIESLQRIVVEIAEECDLKITKFRNHISLVLPDEALHQFHPSLGCNWEDLMQPFRHKQIDSEVKAPCDVEIITDKDAMLPERIKETIGRLVGKKPLIKTAAAIRKALKDKEIVNIANNKDYAEFIINNFREELKGDMKFDDEHKYISKYTNRLTETKNNKTLMWLMTKPEDFEKDHIDRELVEIYNTIKTELGKIKTN